MVINIGGCRKGGMIANSRYMGALLLKKAWKQPLSRREHAAIQETFEKRPSLEARVAQFTDGNWVRSEIQAMAQYRKEKVWQYIQERLSGEGALPLYEWKVRHLRQAAAAYAAVLLGIIASFWLIFPTHHAAVYTDNSIYTGGGSTVMTSSDKTENALLPDGSHVVLAGNSRLSSSADFNEGKREICLQGQAYLDVKGDPAKPFIVHLNNSTIEVLGTQFYVRAYEKDSGDIITLFSGKVGIKIGDSLRLLPCYRRVWIRHDSIQVLSSDSTVTIGGTAENPCWTFHNTSLANTLQWIADWHQFKVSNPEKIIGYGVKDSCLMRDNLTKMLKEIQDAQWDSAYLHVHKRIITVSSKP